MSCCANSFPNFSIEKETYLSLNFNFSQIHENFFSVIKTLILALGQADPCLDMKQYANGLKPILNKCSASDDIVSQPAEHQVLITTGSNVPNYSAPTGNFSNLSHPYNSKLHNQSKDAKSLMDPTLTELEKTKIGGCEKLTCRILLLFSQDGTEYASQAVELAKAVNHDVSLRQYIDYNIYSFYIKFNIQ